VTLRPPDFAVTANALAGAIGPRARVLLLNSPSQPDRSEAPRSRRHVIRQTDVGMDAVEFCAGLPERCGVVAILTSVFYDDRDAAGSLVRFAF
jgi:aspartate/methionine/tyrosine aminotransferase